MVNKSNISSLVKNSELNIKPATLATKEELKAEQEKMWNIFLLVKVFEICLFNILELKLDKSTEYLICWKGLFESKFLP